MGRAEQRDGPRRSLLSKIVIGLACLGLAALVLLSIWIIPVFRDYGRALRTEEEIDRVHARAGVYTPSLDGRIHQDRMEVFLAVRRVLSPSGRALAARREAFLRMEAHRSEAKPRPLDLLRDTWRAVSNFASLPGELGDYVEMRNGALLANRMGLGEYTWLYVVCYVGGLGERPGRVIPDASRPDLFRERVYPQVTQMIRRQVEGASDSPQTDPAAAEDVAAWRGELAALEADPARVPFEDGLPKGLEASIAPYRDQLLALSCPAAAEPDLTRTLRRGLGYDHR